jgi:hypothetical protein
MFQENANRSAEPQAEHRDVINTINNMAYKLCGTMLVNSGDCPELTTAIRRVHEGTLCFQDALLQAATREASGQ